MSVDLRLVAVHGGLLSLAAGTVIMGALWFNPRLFLRHFPPAVRASQPALSRVERVAGRATGAALIALFVGVPVWSAQVAARTDASWVVSFVHAFLVGMTFNLTDWLVLDELWIGIGRPRWALPPGVREADVPFDHRQHFRGFVIGTGLFAVVAALAAALAQLR